MKQSTKLREAKKLRQRQARAALVIEVKTEIRGYNTISHCPSCQGMMVNNVESIAQAVILEDPVLARDAFVHWERQISRDCEYAARWAARVVASGVLS